MQSFHVKNQSSSSPIRFSYWEIDTATNQFASKIDDRNGFFTDYFHGHISGAKYKGEVLVLRLRRWHLAEALIFENEIKVLSVCHHVNIISLVGFCHEKEESFLVYELILDSSLYHNLHMSTKHPRLTVEQRLEILLGVAKGLCYLHSGTDFTVVHGMISSNDIFLDASLVPKITGFGCATISVDGPSSSQEKITKATRVINDYSPPETNEPGYKPSKKGDVYAFGVLLLEVLCERHPSERLLVLALPSIVKGELPKSISKYVKKKITPASARKCEKLIMNCLEYQPEKRPCMNQVVQDLELALKRQKEPQDINFEEQSFYMSNWCQSFSLVEIKRATNEFSKLLGEGAFGKVYHGKISSNGNNIDVAVKFMSIDPERGIPSFEIERKLLSACNHPNIISLIGYCDEKDAKILVYKFMPNGSLYDYIYKHKDITPPLTVEQRLEICIGVAKGVSYLHSRNDYNIIHSDLKCDNILLDANLVPSISDFGLSRFHAISSSTSSMITNHVKGTEGYIAPECYEPNYKPSRKADVYAFGVILLEVLCEKPAWERLVIWALLYVSKGELPKFTPEHVVKNMSRECLRACANLIKDCLENNPDNRPSMGQVIANLDLALALQMMNTHGICQKNKSEAYSQQIFSLSDIEKATNKFSHQNVLGNLKLDFPKANLGGNVYYGNISLDVVVRHRTLNINQIVNLYEKKLGKKIGHRYLVYEHFQEEIEFFQNEINLLSACHHANIISLVGYCDEPRDKIVIYEFMPNGSLYDHLHNKQDSAIHLTVEQRLEICLGVAKGLSYLHSSNIVHGYLNSKNILLDGNFVAKISNFEFSTKGDATYNRKKFHTIIEGMHGYFAPESVVYKQEQSQKADVYAFGVIFLEVLCERLAKDNLVGLAFPSIVRGELAKFTPQHLRTCISQKCAQACENLLMNCLDDDPVKRPFMNQVVDKLEFVLKLQIGEAND